MHSVSFIVIFNFSHFILMSPFKNLRVRDGLGERSTMNHKLLGTLHALSILMVISVSEEGKLMDWEGNLLPTPEL